MPGTTRPRPIAFALERLYQVHDKDWVVDTVPALLGVCSRLGARAPLELKVEHQGSEGHSRQHRIQLVWDLAALETQDRELRERVRRFAGGATAAREHVTELAAYCLAFVAVSVLLPDRRIVAMRRGLPPDFLFDVTPGALRGVEVAGRMDGTRGTLLGIIAGAGAAPGKRVELRRRTDVAEAYLSIWALRAAMSIFFKVKP